MRGSDACVRCGGDPIGHTALPTAFGHLPRGVDADCARERGLDQLDLARLRRLELLFGREPLEFPDREELQREAAAAADRIQPVPLTAVAVSVPGAVGGVVSAAADVVALAIFEYGPKFPAASFARTR